MTFPRVLILPGWLDSGPSHWQSRWQARHGFERVVQHDWQWPRRGDWMARLEEVLMADARPAVLVAHSLGCMLVAAWAAHSAQRQRVSAALLVAPPDIERPDAPPQIQTWRPVPRQPLPFPSTAVLSTNDPFCSVEHGRALAQAWGSEVVEIGAVGHINGDSGLGDWPQGLALLRALVARGQPASSTIAPW